MSESACASFGASPRVSSAIGAGAAGERRQEVSPVFAAPLFRTLPPHTEVIRTYFFSTSYKDLLKVTRYIFNHFYSHLIFWQTRLWNLLQLGIYNAKTSFISTPKESQRFGFGFEASVVVDVDVLMKLELMLVLRNRVCLFTVATLISGPAYGGRWWWATILNALSSSSSSSSASSSSFSSSKFIFCQVILLP